MDNYLTVSRKLALPLKDALDNLEEINDLDQKLFETKFNNPNKDIFKHIHYENNLKHKEVLKNKAFTEKSIEEMNHFNLSIMKTSSWGNDN